MSSSKEEKQIKAAVDAVDWPGLAALSEQDIEKRWRNDPDANWPDANGFAEFEIVNSASSKKHQAAE